MIRQHERIKPDKIMSIATKAIYIASAATLFASVVLACRANDAPNEPHHTEELSGVGRYSTIPVTEIVTEPAVTSVITTETETEVITEPAPASLGTFKLTAYCPCEKCCGQWADGITFTGTTATLGRTIAVDPNVIPLGSTVYINGQAYIAEDIGGAIKGNRVDVFFPTHNEALQFGVQYADVAIEK